MSENLARLPSVNLDDFPTAWDMYYATILGWQFHPGVGKTLDSVDVDLCARLADAMMEERWKRCRS